MSLKSNFEYIRDWCNHRFLRRDESKPSVIVSSTDWTTINRNGVTYNSASAAATAAGITESELEGMVSGELFLPFSFLYGSNRYILCPVGYTNGIIRYRLESDGLNIAIGLGKHGDTYSLSGGAVFA